MQSSVMSDGSGVSVLTTSGAYVFALKMAMLTTLKLLITIKEKLIKRDWPISAFFHGQL